MKLTFGNYIRTMLLILAVIAILGECEDLTTLIISKITSALYIWCLIYANLIRPEKSAKR